MRRILIPLSLTLACSGQVEEETTQTSSNGEQAVQALDPNKFPKSTAVKEPLPKKRKGG